MRAVRSGLGALLALGACGGGAADRPSVELGLGETEFVAVADGDPLVVAPGPQGGWHLYLSVRASGVEPGDPMDLGSGDNPMVTFTAFHDGAQLDAGATYVQGLAASPDDPDVYELLGRLVPLDILDDDEVLGDDVEVSVKLVDADGVERSDARTLVAVADPIND